MRSRTFLSPPHMGGEEEALVRAAFASNWIAPTGPMVSAFEAAISRKTTISHVAALSSGTAGLHLALRLSGVGAGDQVWAATLTFIGGISPILQEGAEPVFLDVEDRTWLLDLDLLEEELRTAQKSGRLPKALITTDLYGYLPDLGRLQELAKQYDFVWISDSAEALGSTWNGIPAGKGAEFAIYSFNGNKIVTTSGGGALASDKADLIERARFLSTQAREPAPHYEHKTYGYNYRLSNICAAIGVGQMNVLETRVNARRRIFDRYREQLKDLEGISFPTEPVGQRANRWLTTIRIDRRVAGFDREDARLALEKENIESRPIWKPMHLQPLFASARRRGGAVAERIFSDGLCLPSGSAMSDEDVDFVAELIRDLGKRHKASIKS